jgi:sterol 3beta-glucosyltransferase
MKITVLVLGTRGDVQPFIALALALGRRGHEVCVATSRGFADLVAHSGARHFPITADYEAWFQSEEGTRWMGASSPDKFKQMLTGEGVGLASRLRPQMNRELLAACEGADAIVANLVIEDSAACIAEKLQRPLFLGYTLPMLPTAEFPSPFFAEHPLPWRGLNRLTHSLLETVYWQGQKRLVNAWRAELGLPAAARSMREKVWRGGAAILHCYSAQLVPRPPEWSASNVITGFWTMPSQEGVFAGGTPSPALIRWLDEGPPPVYLGAWRLPLWTRKDIVGLAADVADTLGIRIVLGAHWSASELAALHVPSNLFITGSVDHEWLFSRCAATVHHGGAGTTAATLRAGLPTVICAICNDQPFWGSRVTALGVGSSMPFKQLTVERLTQALRLTRDSAVRTRAARLGAALRREDGATTAARIIEERLPGAPLLS